MVFLYVPQIAAHIGFLRVIEAASASLAVTLNLAPLLQIHVQPAPAFLMEANAPLPHQAAFATEDALFIACK